MFAKKQASHLKFKVASALFADADKRKRHTHVYQEGPRKPGSASLGLAPPAPPAQASVWVAGSPKSHCVIEKHVRLNYV